ncbi:uncharacterized protein LOC107680580 [Sinocyclocheilus anshuiensis]|uniref:uncharacterized protein LOC107680580 n=1 Tax=Sinocyclocheilus anshuiensis TaxID=1608454 RepID=UPI0007B93D92|nr:PREDICTED: uncharacterized protein LOC107680580 [Sinocyclocheilus anshuiensis]
MPCWTSMLPVFRACSERKLLAQEKCLKCQLFGIYDLQEKVDVHVRRAAILRALPAYLQEDDSNFFKTWDVEQSDEPDIDDVPLGLLSISGNSTDATFFCPEKIAVVLKGNMVTDFPTLADAFVMLFGLTYALDLSYPKEFANTFDFTQKVLMGLEDGKLRPRAFGSGVTTVFEQSLQRYSFIVYLERNAESISRMSGRVSRNEMDHSQEVNPGI